MKRKVIVIIVGPSGCGKNTLGEVLEENGIPRLVTTTTRAMREGEKEGVTYYYTSKKEFHSIDKIEETEYAEEMYGLSVREVEEKLSNYEKVFIIMDQVGVANMRKIYGNLVKSIFIKIDPEQMIERVRARGDSIETLKKRIEHSNRTKEFEMSSADYVLENHNLPQAKEDLLAIVQNI